MSRFLLKLHDLVVCHYDLVMLLIFSLIIFVSKTPIIGSTPKITRSAVKHGPIFPKSSMIVDYSSGDLSQAIQEQQKSDLLVVYFYAPWDSQSIKRSGTFKRVSELFREGVTFVAINCWEPTGSCASETYLTRFPTVAIYIRGVHPVVYDGPLRADYLAAFIYRATRPYHVIYTPDNLTNLFAKYDNIITGYFNFSISLRPPGFFQFYAASLKLLSKGITSRYTTMAVIVGEETATKLNLTVSGGIAIFRLNKTTVYPSLKGQFHKCSDIWKILWTPGHIQPPIVLWLQPSGTKSRLMDTALSLGPAAILLHRHNHLSSLNHEIIMLRELAQVYRTCPPLKYQPSALHSRTARNAEQTLQYRWMKVCVRWRDFLQDYAPTCPHVALQRSQCSSSAWLKATNRCTVCDPQMLGVDLCPSSSISCHSLFNSASVPVDDLSRRLYCNPSRRGIIRQEAMRLWHVGEGLKPKENETDGSLRDSERKVDDKCRRIRLTEEITPSDKTVPHSPEGLDDPSVQAHVESEIKGLNCRSNRSLNFFAVDRGLYPVLSEQLDVNSTVKSTTLVVIDWKNEGVFAMRDDFRYVNAATFIANFHKKKLASNRRTSEKSLVPIKNDVMKHDLTGRSITTALRDNTKEMVVYYFYPSCGFCSMFMHRFRNLAHYFSNQNSIVFTRVNVAENDLPYELQVEHLPTIIMFPPAKSRRQPAIMRLHQHVTLADLVSFVLRSSVSQVFLRAASHACDQLCLSGNHERLIHHLSELQNLRSLSSKLLKSSVKRLDSLNSKISGMLKYKRTIGDWSDWLSWWRDYLPSQKEFNLLNNFYNHRFLKLTEYDKKIFNVMRVIEHMDLHWKNPEALWTAILTDANKVLI